MDKSRDLFIKISNGGRELTDDEAELILELLSVVKLDEQGNFMLDEKRHEKHRRGIVAPPPDSCLSCGRPF
ncbi:hypothetical protein [Planococcus citreus]|uniref:Uncharacterized protein n=1 Tax=Planococcus citreus TaxID=1373 RepID=A0A497YLK3_9BACL|nr:hypothetical protein [Planococcus citreus]RLJ90640.1 hypothetical protein DFR62_0785 [Planococcus citreus]